MEIPKTIKKSIINCAEYYKRATMCEKEIMNWMYENKLTEETSEKVENNMDDYFIDCCTLSYNPERFIKELEEL